MNNIKVLGVGSPFGDDRAGWIVVEMLQQKSELIPYIPEQLYLENLDRPCTRLLEYVFDTETVILIDAVRSGTNLGKIHHFENPQLKNSANSFSTHAMGVIQTLQLGAALNILPKHIILFGIEINEINYEKNLSDAVYAAAISLEKIITAKIFDLLTSHGILHF